MLADIYPLVRQRCAGVMDIMMDDAIRSSYREFCAKSELLISDFEIPTITELTPVQTPPLSTHTILKLATVISIKNKKTHKLSAGKDYQFDPVSNEIIFFKDHELVQIKVINKPKFGFDETLMSQMILDNFDEFIADGAAKILRLQPGTKWFSPDLSQYYERSFIEGYRKAYRLGKDKFAIFENNTRKHQFY